MKTKIRETNTQDNLRTAFFFNKNDRYGVRKPAYLK